MLFNGKYVSVDKNTGIGLPDYSKLLPAFGYEYFSLEDWTLTDKSISTFLNHEGPAVLEVFMDPDQGFLPKVKGAPMDDGNILAPPIEEMSPLVSMEELKDEMIIKLSKKSTKIKR